MYIFRCDDARKTITIMLSTVINACISMLIKLGFDWPFENALGHLRKSRFYEVQGTSKSKHMPYACALLIFEQIDADAVRATLAGIKCGGWIPNSLCKNNKIWPLGMGLPCRYNLYVYM